MSREPIFIGGLMRCCIETLRLRTTAAAEGEEQPCQWCSSGAIFKDGAWRWLGPAADG